MRALIALWLILSTTHLYAQYWQQEIDYTMSVTFDDEVHRYKGVQEIVYTNNSPETLDEVYFHLFPNAFQPGSMMDVRSRNIEDPDPRVGDRISKLSSDEQGYLHVRAVRSKGANLSIEAHETLLLVRLNKALKPGKKLKLQLEFEGQVPKQIRRSGRNNREGVAYSMAQWYPKMCEFDEKGWHAYPYIGREFHGVWGRFDVKITIDSAYTLAATGTLQNPEHIGKGYLPEGKKSKISASPTRTWHFIADNVHDFAWAADKDYVHRTMQVVDGPLLRFFHKDSPDLVSNWERLPEYTAEAFRYASEEFGPYPYPEYNVVQGGDGGMEYPMLTLITGQRKLGSLVGVTVHELIHSWYQLLLGTNEALYPWMDEGFTTYAGNKVMGHLFDKEADTRSGSYVNGYIALALSGKEEPMSKHADHYNTNYAYGAAAYNKGGTFVAQLGYVIGDDVLRSGLRRYFHEWKFKHPDPFDFIRVLEKESGIHLGWYLDYMMNTTETIDYGIDTVLVEAGKTVVQLERKGNFPMPIDLQVTYMDGSNETIHIPLAMMLKAKNAEDNNPYSVRDPWPWTHPEYLVRINRPLDEIEKIEIDASKRMADVNRDNNLYTRSDNNFEINSQD